MTPDRQSPRTVLDRILCIQIEPDNHAIVRNISDEGLGFHAVYPIAESGMIRFSFPEQNGHRIEATGELVWTDSTKKTGGLRFASLSGACHEQIRNWVAQAAAPANTGAASAAATPQPKEMPFPGVSPPRASVAPTPHVPPPVMPLPQPFTAPYFAVFDDNSTHEGYTQDQEMSFPHARTKLFLGFVTGVIVSTILVAAILFFADGYRVGGSLTTWRAPIGASPAPQVAPAVSPPAAVPPPLVSSDSPSAGSIEASAASAHHSGVAGDSKGNGASGQRATEPPFVEDHVTRAPESLPPVAADPGDADLALAQSYLSGKTGPPGSTAAASFLWAAVEKGNVTAEITLADLYARGDGVTKSCEQARVLLRAAAGKSSSEASQNLSQIIRRDCP
jgi:hypothetical protein